MTIIAITIIITTIIVTTIANHTRRRPSSFFRPGLWIAPIIQGFIIFAICTLALSRHLGYPPSACLLEEIERIERENIYQRQVFFLENLGFCQPTEARKISSDDSLRFEQIHAEVYTSLGYQLIKVALETLEQRVYHIMNWMKDC